MKKNFKKIIGTGLLVGISALIVFVGFKNSSVSAQPQNGALHGVLWSDMPDKSDQSPGKASTDQFAGRGFGYISTNSADVPGYSGNPYSVTLNPTGTFAGHAWGDLATVSPTDANGWLDFAPGGSFPDEHGNIKANAVVDPTCLTAHGSSCAVSGWIRFAAGETSSNAGGWDGWVSLRGAWKGYAYGVTYDANPSDPLQCSTGPNGHCTGYGYFSGCAWGSTDTGWICFNNVNAKITQIPTVTATCGTSNGGTFTTAPITSLCSVGTASAPISTTTGWVWTCSYLPMSGNASTTKCTATKGTTPPTIYYCTDSTGAIVSYTDPTQVPTGCTPVTTGGGDPQSACTTPFNKNKIWYGPAGGSAPSSGNGVCVESACPLNFELGFITQIPDGYEMNSAGVCVPITVQSGSGGSPGPIKPIYKEN